MIPLLSRKPGKARHAGRLVALAALLVIGLFGGVAQAQSPTMRERVYDKLSKAQVAATEGDYEKALELLRDVEKSKDLSPYETAQLHTAFGFVAYSREDYRTAASHYRIALQQEDLPPAMVSLTLYTLAQLNFMLEDYQAAAEGLEQWLATATGPGPEAYVLLAQAYYKLERFRDALVPLQTAIDLAASTGRSVQEGWYLLLRVLYYELEDWQEVLGVMEILVTRYPKKEYWVQLAATYGELDDAKGRLAAYDAAYVQGFLDRQEDIMAYSQLLAQAGAPYRGAVVLARGLEEGRVQRTERTLRLLSEMWTIAKEADRALEALAAAAEMSEDGEAEARLAQLHLNREETEKALKTARRALEKGVKDEGQVRLVMGMALFEEERYEDAKSAFREALASPDAKPMASEWIAYIEREQDRIFQMEQGLRP